MKGLFIFAAGVVAGAVAGVYLVKDKVMADAKQEIEEVREYYKSKKETKKEEKPVEEKQEETKVEEKEEYQEITRNYTNYNKPGEQPKKVVEDMPYVIDVEEFGELPEYDTANYTYFSDGVLVDDVDDVIDDPDPIIGLENLKIFEEFPGCSAIYVRNDIWRMDFEVLKDDWNWADCQDEPTSNVEKKPHQL
jgi:hypothetical protein